MEGGGKRSASSRGSEMMIAMGKSLPSRRLPWPLGKALSRPEGETRVVSHYFGFRHQRRADINVMTQFGRE